MDAQQNKFYSSISKYYSEIFPYKPVQLQFVKNRVGELSGKSVLDIGCATGELSFRLGKEGASVVGVDLNNDLLQQAKSEKANPNICYQERNMLHLENDFQQGQFDAVLCFGNTLVHLETKEVILKMLKGVFKVLKSNGTFLLQILNYDYILKEPVTQLPLIETKNIQFTRKYQIPENDPLIQFQTELILKNENDSISNETSLLALGSDNLKDLLTQAGFKKIELYSNFKRDAFGGKHLPLVVSCTK